MDIVLKPKETTRFFALIAIGLILAHIVGQFCALILGHEYVFGLVPLFNLDRENNLPTLYSSLALLFCAALLVIITVARKKSGKSYFAWSGLAVIFMFLSADEAIIIHERMVEPVRSALTTSSFFYFAWLIPYGIAFAVFLLAYCKFIFTLPKRTRLLFILAGVMYAVAVIGLEMIGGRHFELHGMDGTYVIITTIEESLEMAGIVIFIYALTSYIDSELHDLRLRIASSASG